MNSSPRYDAAPLAARATAVPPSGRRRKTRSNYPAKAWITATFVTPATVASVDTGGLEGGAA